MNSIYKQLTRLKEYDLVKQALGNQETPIVLQGVSPIHKAQFIHTLSKDCGKGAFVVTQDEQTAARLTDEINLLEGAVVAYHYPEREVTLRAVDGISIKYCSLSSSW